MKIYVGNLAEEITEEELQLAAAEFGKVESVTLVKDKDSGLPKGFAFVDMATDAETKAAVEGLNGKMMADKAITASEARNQGDGRGNRGQVNKEGQANHSVYAGKRGRTGARGGVYGNKGQNPGDRGGRVGQGQGRGR